MKAAFKKTHYGPGGIKCPCCRPAGCRTLKEARKIAARKYRRSAWSEVVSQLRDIESLLAVGR